MARTFFCNVIGRWFVDLNTAKYYALEPVQNVFLTKLLIV